ncbi:somatostatin receptor type 5-like [Megalops cyprinoides]|uniref:somatostatin receptor type 5-like n=1 Tax=Megalops cyprinoides TaxID=118141 RepID=UPI0018655154|nr:somatostatin receptor type 5-like [Megalops cyprinoides]
MHLSCCQQSTVIYLVSLAVVDTLFMVLGGLVDVGASWQESAASRAPNALLCSAVTFNEEWTLSSSQWIVTALTLERYLISRARGPRPRRCCRLSRPQVALLLVLVAVISSQILSLPLCWLYQTWPGGGEAEVWPGLALLWSNGSRAPLASRCRVLRSPHIPATLWFHPLLAGCLPMSLTLLLSVLVSLHFHRRARALVAPRSIAPFRTTGSRMRRSGRIQLAAALVAVFLALPRYVTQGLLAWVGKQAGLDRGLGVAMGVALMLQWLSLVIHFLLYCFLSSGFRRETLALLRRLCHGATKPQHPWTNRCARSPAPTPGQPCQMFITRVADDSFAFLSEASLVAH